MLLDVLSQKRLNQDLKDRLINEVLTTMSIHCPLHLEG